MSLRVQTSRVSEKQVIREIRESFGLNQYPFTDMDDNLILLAFTPTCGGNIISRNTQKIIQNTYGTCNFQTLEFYGDRILYDVFTGIFYGMFGLTNTPQFLTNLMSYMTKNRTLTDIMLNKGACKYLRSRTYTIREDRSFHNICADAFEALIGALYVHLNQTGLNHVTYITEWLLKNTEVSFLLRQYLNSVGMDNTLVYNAVDRESLINKINSYREEDLQRLEKLRPELGEELYFSILNALEEELVSEEDFAPFSVIVDVNEPLYSVYDKLEWTYSAPEYDDTFGRYFVYGYPGGKEKIIGVGETPEEAIEDTRNYLLHMGYIVNMKNPKRYFG
nr:ribonuclease III [Cedratvirus duvanny]